MSPAEALLHYRTHGVAQQPTVHAVSVPLQHDAVRASLLPFVPAPMQHQALDQKHHLLLPLNQEEQQQQQFHGQGEPPVQQLLQEQPPPQEHLQDRRRDIFGPPIARFAPMELPRIVLPLRSACGIKPTSAAAATNASPGAPGRASIPAPAFPVAVDAERQKPEAVGRLAREFDMSSVVVGDMVGRGAFGEVYKASYMGQQVAVKQIMTNHVPSHMMQDIQFEFQKEVEVMQKLNHPNIVAYIGSSVLGSGVAGVCRLLACPVLCRFPRHCHRAGIGTQYIFR